MFACTSKHTLISHDSERIGQGRENARQFLLDNPQIADKIEAQVRKNAGLIADELLVGPGEGDDLDDEATG